MTRDVLDALTRIRESAEAHMDERDRERLGCSSRAFSHTCALRRVVAPGLAPR